MSMSSNGSNSNGSKRLSAEINVTPLIDVLLVLLIIFMVIQPAVVQGLDALVPQPPKDPQHAETTPETVVVEVLSADGHGVTYRINQQPLERDEIASKLAGIFALRQNKVLFVRGDAALDFAAVAEVIDAAHSAGVNDVGIITARSATN